MMGGDLLDVAVKYLDSQLLVLKSGEECEGGNGRKGGAKGPRAIGRSWFGPCLVA